MSLIIYLISIALSGVALFLGLSNDMFGVFKNDPSKVQFASFAVALIIIVVGDRLATFHNAKVQRKKFTDIVTGNFKQVPHLYVIEETGPKRAMRYIAKQMSDCSSIVNTKISHDSFEPDFNVRDIYNKELMKALKNGLSYDEVISTGFVKCSLKLHEHSNKCNGKYRYRVQEQVPSSFLNFCVLHFKDENIGPELLIGWATSNALSHKDKVYKIRDVRIVEYFTTYFESLTLNQITETPL